MTMMMKSFEPKWSIFRKTVVCVCIYIYIVFLTVHTFLPTRLFITMHVK